MTDPSRPRQTYSLWIASPTGSATYQMDNASISLGGGSFVQDGRELHGHHGRMIVWGGTGGTDLIQAAGWHPSGSAATQFLAERRPDPATTCGAVATASSAVPREPEQFEWRLLESSRHRYPSFQIPALYSCMVRSVEK